MYGQLKFLNLGGEEGAGVEEIFFKIVYFPISATYTRNKK